MLQEIALTRTVRPSLIEDIPIIEFASVDTALVCPYFHQRFFTPDGRFLVVEAQFDGKPEAVLVDTADARAFRLTEGGAHVHTGDLALDDRTFYFVWEGTVWSVDIVIGEQIERWPMPGGEEWTPLKSVHLNSDGTMIGVVANREHASGVKIGRVWAMSASDGSCECVIERPFQIGHIQFSTSDPTLMMYCHETGGAAPQRMWLARTGGNHPGPLFDDPGHPWVTHETFCGDGSLVVFIRHPEGIGLVRPDNSGFEPVGAPGAWHAGPTHDVSAIVYDTHDGRLCVLDRASGKHHTLSDREYAGDKHVHPRFLLDDETIVWTSSEGGVPHVAVANVEAILRG